MLTDPQSAQPQSAQSQSPQSQSVPIAIGSQSVPAPSAFRPYFQEGYMAGTADVTVDFDSKTELDFRNRLIGKFAIPRAKTFWGKGFKGIPDTALFPKGDQVLELCTGLKLGMREELQTGNLGEFIKVWAGVEEYLLKSARWATERNVSVREAIVSLQKRGDLSLAQAAALDQLRRFRNQVVHRPSTVQSGALGESMEIAKRLKEELGRRFATRSKPAQR